MDDRISVRILSAASVDFSDEPTSPPGRVGWPIKFCDCAVVRRTLRSLPSTVKTAMSVAKIAKEVLLFLIESVIIIVLYTLSIQMSSLQLRQTNSKFEMG